MSQDNNEAKSPESWPPGSPERVAHSVGLYEKARELLSKQPLSAETVKLVIAMAEDALIGLGATNQTLKVKLGAIIEEARDALPPANFDELKKRGEGKVLEKIYRPGRIARNVLSVGGVLLAVIVVAFPVVRSFSGRDETAEAVPARVELTPTPLPTRPAPPEVIFTPTPAPATPEPTPTPTPTASPQPTPPPPAEKQFLVNATPRWGRLISYIEWRVAAIQPLGPKGTRFIFEIRNTHESTEWSCYSFDRAPLIVIEKDTGRMFPMLGQTHLPSDIQERNGKWYIQSGRTIRAAVDFGVITNGSFAGKVEYKDQNRADPAQFLYAP